MTCSFRNLWLLLGAPMALLFLAAVAAPWRSTWVGPDTAFSFLELPPQASEPKHSPIVIWLHGRDQHPEETYESLKNADLAARVIIPAAPDWHRRGLSWYPSADSDPDRSELRGRARQLDEFLASLGGKAPQASPLIIVGFSQGAALALTLAASSKNDLRAVIAVAGALPLSLDGEARRSSPPSVFIIHGESDRAVPSRLAEEAAAKLRNHGHTEISVRLIANAGHAMSGSLLVATLEQLRLTLVQ